MSIKNNTTLLNSLLEQVNNLPDAGGVELPELTTPASVDQVFLDKEYIDADGNKKIGTFTIDSELSTQDGLIAQIQSALEGKASGSDSSSGDPDLPTGYRRVNYIQFNAAQTVDTGIICNQNTKIRILFTRESSNSQYLYGVANSDNTASVTAYFSSSGSWRFGNKSTAKTIDTNNDIIQTAIVDKTGVVMPNNTSAYSSVSDFQTIGSLILGGCRLASGDVGNAQFIGKIFIFEIWEGEEQVLKWIPVVDKDGTYRFFDMITKTFADSLTSTALEGGNL